MTPLVLQALLAGAAPALLLWGSGFTSGLLGQGRWAASAQYHMLARQNQAAGTWATHSIFLVSLSHVLVVQSWTP